MGEVRVGKSELEMAYHPKDITVRIEFIFDNLIYAEKLYEQLLEAAKTGEIILHWWPSAESVTELA